MPLPLLGALVVLGIGGVVLLVHLLRLSRPLGFADEAAARAAYLADYPDDEVVSVLLADDGHAAVLGTRAGLGLVAALGAGRLTRRLGPGDLSGVEERRGALRLRLDDWGAPAVTLACADAARRSEMKRMLEEGR